MFAFAVVSLLVLNIAAGDEAGEAERLLKQGVELRKQRQDAQALRVFREAHALHPTPRSLAQIALAEHALGAWIDADLHLEEALSNAADPWIRSNRQPLELAAAQIVRHVARIMIRGAPDGARVRISGPEPRELQAPLAAPFRTRCGIELSIEVVAGGYERFARTWTPACGAEENVDVFLAKSTVARSPPPAPKPREVAVVAPIAPESASPPFAAYALVAGGGALLTAAGGVAALFVRESHAERYNSDGCLPLNGKTRDENCGGEREAAERAELLSIVGFSAGGALAVTAAVLFALDEPEPETRVACAPAGSGFGVACAMRF